MPAQTTPRWVRTVTVAAVSVVALVAATASFAHVHTLAERAGEGWRALLSPLSVDGLLVAASMVMLVRRRAGLPAGVLPWTGLVLGLGASLAANVAAAHPEWRTPVLDGVVSAWPAVALAISFELLILVVREQPTRRTVADHPALEQPAPTPEPRPERERSPRPAPGGLPARAKPRRTPSVSTQQRAEERKTRHDAGDHSMCQSKTCRVARKRAEEGRVRAVRAA